MPFTPVKTQRHDPPNRADDLTAAVVTALQRPAPRVMAWGVGKTVAVGLLTAGLGPMLALPLKFRNYAALERRQYEHLAEWLDLRGGADGLTPLALRLGFSRGIYAITVLAAAVAFGAAQLYLFTGGGWWTGLGYAYFPASHGELFPRGSGSDVPLGVTFLASLTVGYLANVWQVNRHALAADRFIDAFNASGGSAGGAARGPGFQWGLDAWTVVAGIALALLTILWGVPMMLAAGVQRRYVAVNGPKARRSLAERVRLRVEADRPAVDVSRPAFHEGECPNPQCHAPLPPGSQFCPRCGETIKRRRVDQLA